MKTTKFRLLALFAILLLAGGLRLWQINTLPPGFHLDEAYEGTEAWLILTDPTYRPIFLEGGFGVPPVNAYANAITFGLFQHFGGEVGPVAMRTTAAMVGLLGVLALYLLAEEMRRHEEALPPLFPLFAAASLAMLRWHIHFSRMGIEPIFVPLLWTVGAWLLLRSWRTGNLLTFVVTGVALAATLYTYAAAWIIPFLALVILASLVWKEPTALRRRWVGLLLCGGVAFGLVAPLLLFFWHRPDLMLMRSRQISVIADAEQPDLWGNIWITVRMFALWGASGDPDLRRNIPNMPVLNLWLTIPFYVGVLVALWRVKRPVYAMLLVGMVGLALPGIVTTQAPHFHRILGMSAPTALLIGLGASLPLTMIGRERWTKGLRYAAIGAGVVLLGVGGASSAYDYFGVWAKSPALYYAFDGGLWDAGRWMMKMPADTPIFFTPRTITHPTLEFSLLTAPKPKLNTFDGRSVFPAQAGPPRLTNSTWSWNRRTSAPGSSCPKCCPMPRSLGNGRTGTGISVLGSTPGRPAACPAVRPKILSPPTWGMASACWGMTCCPGIPTPAASSMCNCTGPWTAPPPRIGPSLSTSSPRRTRRTRDGH